MSCLFLFAHLTAQGSYESIAGYKPMSKVTDHSAIDLDQAAMEFALDNLNWEVRQSPTVELELLSRNAYRD